MESEWPFSEKSLGIKCRLLFLHPVLREGEKMHCQLVEFG